LLTQREYAAGFPTNWGTYGGFPEHIVPADYEMDSDPLRSIQTGRVAVDPIKLAKAQGRSARATILSVTLPMIDMFGTNGIYYSSHVEDKIFPTKSARWRCSCRGTTAFRRFADQWTWKRQPHADKKSKHGFQLKFKGDFGESSLNYRLYPDSPVEDFDDIILRPDFNSSWRHWSDSAGNGNGAFQRTRATRFAMRSCKNTFRDMGDIASHHRFFHLFINGLYWGTYDFAEQPVDGFGKSYFGGEKADYALS
jgi:hypothetical protein